MTVVDVKTGHTSKCPDCGWEPAWTNAKMVTGLVVLMVCAECNQVVNVRVVGRVIVSVGP